MTPFPCGKDSLTMWITSPVGHLFEEDKAPGLAAMRPLDTFGQHVASKEPGFCALFARGLAVGMEERQRQKRLMHK